MSDTLKALDDLGELLDQLASNAREFDYNTANRMERDAAKALLAIEAAVNARRTSHSKDVKDTP